MRLFVGNFSFEQAWDPGHNSTQQVEQLEAELACVWLAVAEPGDEILTPRPISPEFWKRMTGLGAPPVHPLTATDLHSSKSEILIPWGWTPSVRKLAATLKIATTAPDQEVVWRVNSRDFAFGICQELGEILSGEGIARTLEQAVELIQQNLNAGRAWIVKPLQGQAGRGQLRGSDFPTDKQLATVRRLIERQAGVHIEPLLDRVCEIGVQWEIPATGEPQLLGLTELLSDSRGVYAGSRMNPVVISGSARETLLNTQLKIVTSLQQEGYFGPVGIDSMLYREENEIRLRPVQDVNARWTMGRIGWEWSKRLNSGTEGVSWLHSRTSPASEAVPLSPETIAGIPVQRRTWWLNPGLADLHMTNVSIS
ncbi:hypothetical protein SH661x_001305 [Planctomicrobium sp. SH661]|uniref:hypothetical protein n=1 Tax=Planctomicrobium sp. SH661 TaxID=3448124 RepID=UPI003F5C2981